MAKKRLKDIPPVCEAFYFFEKESVGRKPTEKEGKLRRLNEHVIQRLLDSLLAGPHLVHVDGNAFFDTGKSFYDEVSKPRMRADETFIEKIDFESFRGFRSQDSDCGDRPDFSFSFGNSKVFLEIKWNELDNKGLIEQIQKYRAISNGLPVFLLVRQKKNEKTLSDLKKEGAIILGYSEVDKWARDTLTKLDKAKGSDETDRLRLIHLKAYLAALSSIIHSRDDAEENPKFFGERESEIRGFLEGALPIEEGWHAKQNPSIERFFHAAVNSNRDFYDVRTHETIHSNVWVCIGIGGFKGNLIFQTWLASDKEGRRSLQKRNQTYQELLHQINLHPLRLWKASDGRGGRLFSFPLPLFSSFNQKEELKRKEWCFCSFIVDFGVAKEAIESLLAYLKKELHLLPENFHQGEVSEKRSGL